MKKSDNSFNTLSLKGQYKATKKRTQIQTIFYYLQDNVATATMVSEATGVPQKCITRYKADLEKSNRLAEVKKARCKITNRPAYYLTTNPDLFPASNQLNLNLF